MNSFAEIIKIPDFCGPGCSVYSVRRIGNFDVTEFEKWIEINQTYKKVEDEYKDILEWIRRMGQTEGAREEWFREEREADGLPLPARFLSIQYEFDLRLYCLRLTDNVLVLFSGAVKSERTAQQCPQVRGHFEYANEVAKEIKELIESQEIKIVDKQIVSNGNITIIND